MGPVGSVGFLGSFVLSLGGLCGICGIYRAMSAYECVCVCMGACVCIRAYICLCDVRAPYDMDERGLAGAGFRGEWVQVCGTCGICRMFFVFCCCTLFGRALWDLWDLPCYECVLVRM